MRSVAALGKAWIGHDRSNTTEMTARKRGLMIGRRRRRRKTSKAIETKKRERERAIADALSAFLLS